MGSRSHAKILCCSHVVGYLEASTIHDGVAILSITGTAASVRGLPDLTAPSRQLWTNRQPWKNNVDNVNSDNVNDDVDDQNSDVLLEPRHSRGARRAERVNRRMRRAAGGSRGHSKHLDQGTVNDFSTTSPASTRQLVEYASRNPESKPVVTVIRARRAKPCSYCHVPYHHRIAPFSNMKLVPCLLCGKKWVPGKSRQSGAFCDKSF